MNESGSVAALSALAHEHRLRVFRLPVRSGPGGLSAGDIAVAIGPTGGAGNRRLLQRNAVGDRGELVLSSRFRFRLWTA